MTGLVRSVPSMEWTFNGTDELRQALKDLDIRRGLERLHRVTRLTELAAPEQVIHDSYRSLEKSVKELGSRWASVEAIYPEYQIWEKASTDFAEAWENKCQHCTYILDEEPESELEAWCQKYTVSTRTMPKPCPDFTDERN